jgi:hypothetical protein
LPLGIANRNQHVISHLGIDLDYQWTIWTINGPMSRLSSHPSLFKLIRGIVRGTDSQRCKRAQHMKIHVQAIENQA